MKIPIQKIYQSEVLEVEESVDLSKLVEVNSDLRKIGSVSVRCEASINDNLIHTQLNIVGEMVLPCARTLIDVNYPFEIDTLELFSEHPLTSEEEEGEIHLVEGEILDLEPYIRENVLLEIPMRVFASEEEIKKHAIDSGEGWSVLSEEEKSNEIDPRMAKLKALLPENKNENQ